MNEVKIVSTNKRPSRGKMLKEMLRSKVKYYVCWRYELYSFL